jgi:hypothetical protein
VSDGLLFQTSGGHLIKQGLEEMIIIAVNQDDIVSMTGQSPGGTDSAKAHADYDDPFFLHVLLFSLVVVLWLSSSSVPLEM